MNKLTLKKPAINEVEMMEHFSSSMMFNFLLCRHWKTHIDPDCSVVQPEGQELHESEEFMAL